MTLGVEGSSPSDRAKLVQMDVATLITNWESALVGLVLRHPDPAVKLRLSIMGRPHYVRILFTFNDLPDSQTYANHDIFEYYFHADHWPGIEKARLWILAVWALFAEHEALEMTRLFDSQLADPHASPWCAAHRKALDRRHDMNFMLARIWG